MIPIINKDSITSRIRAEYSGIAPGIPVDALEMRMRRIHILAFKLRVYEIQRVKLIEQQKNFEY